MSRRRVHSPSELVGRRGSVRVGGRITDVNRRRAQLADALGTVTVRFDEPADLARGDHALVEGQLVRGRVDRARLLHKQRPRGEWPGAETARFQVGCVGRALVARARALEAIRRFFRTRGFIEVDTPIRTRGPALDVHIDSMKTEDGWLITSPEHHMKRLLAGGVPRVFQTVHCFRRGELGAWHQPEFAMLEWYRSFEEMDSVMRDTEQLVALVVKKLGGRSSVRVGQGRPVDVRPPYERITVREAFRRYANVADAIALAAENEDEFFQTLVDRVEPALAKRRRPVFLVGYPATQASLARLDESDPTVAKRFELYVGGVELCNGFDELTDANEQRVRFARDRRDRRRKRLPVLPVDEDFLGALSEGMPPAAGNALGLDRLVALALGTPLAEAISFPWRVE